jgi:hypothetical protein
MSTIYNIFAFGKIKNYGISMNINLNLVIARERLHPRMSNVISKNSVLETSITIKTFYQLEFMGKLINLEKEWMFEEQRYNIKRFEEKCGKFIERDGILKINGI